MSPLTQLTMYGWLPVVLMLFAVLEPRRAVSWAFALGWCFLPVVAFSFNGLPDYTKTSATMLGIFLGTAVFHLGLLLSFRPRWFDIPVVILCVSPVFSSLANGLGLYDGQSAALDQTVAWGIPYLIGRIHFHSLEELHDLVLPVLACAFVYVPLCLYEVRMSPQLHATVYGFMQHSFFQTMRGGGWRPMVFMSHGLQVGMWMGTAVLLLTSWIVIARKLTIRIFGFEVPALPIWFALVATFALLKSTGAVLLTLLGVGALLVSQVLRNPAPLFAIAVLCVVYLAVRSTNAWDGEYLVQRAAQISPERAQSLQFRIDNENMLAQKALERPMWGWAGWGRARVYDEEGRDISVTDGAWIIALGNHGIIGLVGLYGTMLLGPLALLLVCPVKQWSKKPETALGASIAAACLIAAADSLPNDHQIPVLTMALGASVSIFYGERIRLSESADAPSPDANDEGV